MNIIGDPELRLLNKLGEGGFGKVYLCESKRQGERKHVVVKRIEVHNIDSLQKMVIHELYVFSQLKHPRIVQYIRSFVYGTSINIVMEYLPRGTLQQLIATMRRAGKRFSHHNLVRHFCDLVMGLEYLHIRHVIHRDIKPENLLLDTSGRLKITDFGISAIHTPDREHCGKFGTYLYMAPEILLYDKCEFKSDVWSVGCIVFELCMLHSPFSHARSVEELTSLVRQRLNFQPILISYGQTWAGVCEYMLRFDPSKRIKLSEIVPLWPDITIPYYKSYFDYKY